MTNAATAESTIPQYLLFQLFTGVVGPGSGVYHRALTRDGLLTSARNIVDAVRPRSRDADRMTGFAVGPIAMDQGADDARSTIRDAFDVAVETDLAVALHLDDYMFWTRAQWPDGRQLRASRGASEWKDWSGTPAPSLQIGWLANVQLAPQLCYESPEVRDFVAFWTRDVIGREVKTQLERLASAGKAQLFAGVIAGWETNLADGYCSLSHLGYNAQKPPADFDHERERVLQRHIERWTKGIYEAGISDELIFTHLAPIAKSDYEKLSAMFSRAQIREMPQSTAFRAFWPAFNGYSTPGFSGYQAEGRFEDIYNALREHGAKNWAMAEGTNAVLGPGTGAVPRSPIDWETYLARNFNHGASIVNLFAGFQGPPGSVKSPTESEEAFATYRKFLRGDRLVEGKAR